MAITIQKDTGLITLATCNTEYQMKTDEYLKSDLADADKTQTPVKKDASDKKD